jgi:Leucine-rich repeat (LRR) protein
MDADTNRAENLESASSLLGIPVQEMTALLLQEFDAIKADRFEASLYPSTEREFFNVAIHRLNILPTQDVAVLQKLIHRDEPRRLYFFPPEIEAVRRILSIIENEGVYFLDLSGLELSSLPRLLEKTYHLDSLDISRNGLQTIYHRISAYYGITKN